MSTCPFCKAQLTRADLRSGRCPACRQALAPEGGEGRRPGEPATNGVSAGGAGEEGARADERKEVARTLEAGAPSERPPGEEDVGTADEQGIAETLEGVGPGERPPSEEGGTADERRVAETIASDAVPAGVGVKEEAPAAEDIDLARTSDFDDSSAQMADRLSAMWSDAFQVEASPMHTIKTDLHSVVAESKLIVQSRVVRGRDDRETPRADYELMDLLGEGGMGIVYSARQASLGRVVALKMLRPEKAGDERQSKAFLAEAAVTGELEHPNIVPIYDLGIRDSDALFYSMKRVKGIAWSEVLAEKTLRENVEILMRVSDAIAFAHSRDVIHRDLKPENIMLGDYGEVLLMDWGLAMSVSGRNGSGMGGTPAYMAPEMATGPVDSLGIHSDVYLLGAILFEIIAGNPPHAGRNVQQCLIAASRNRIRPTSQSGELLDIAMKALSTAAEDRYESVQAFQAAIRDYQSHSESNLLADRAEEDLNQARRSDDYQAYARALFGFQEAVELWTGNTKAREGVSQASLAYAASALRKGDYDLGASLLDPDNPDHAELHRQIKAAERERNSRERRLRAAKRMAVVLILTILGVVTAALFVTRHLKNMADQQRDRAVAAEGDAIQQRDRAVVAEKEAVTQKDRAVEAEGVAKDERDRAVVAEEEALQQKHEAEVARDFAKEKQVEAEEAREHEVYGAYISKIGLIAANIDENAFDRARELLGECPQDLRQWEWDRLDYLCTRAFREYDAEQPTEAVAFAPDGKRFATGGWGPAVLIWDVEDSGGPVLRIDTAAEYVFALAFSPDGTQLAIGTNRRPDYLKIWDPNTGNELRTLRGAAAEHADAVVSVAFSRDGRRLLSSSYDGQAILWDLQTGGARSFRGHYDTVWSAAFSPDESQIVTASQDGHAVVWSLETGKAGPPFLGHVGPVFAAAFSPDGRQVASAGYDRQILIWEPDQVQEFDYDSLKNGEHAAPTGYQSLIGHTAAVRSVCFSDDGRLVLSSGNDNTLRLWDATTGELLKTLRGHGGRVPSCTFSPGGQMILSGGQDSTARMWRLEDNKKSLVFGGRVLQGHRDGVLGAAFSADGQRIVTASRDRTAMVWDLEAGGPPLVLREGHEFLASCGLFFPDGRRLATAAVDGTTRIWDAASGTQLLAIEGTGPSAAVALSHDGTWMLSSSDDPAESREEGNRTARIWDTVTGQLRLVLGGHGSEVTAVAVSPDDSLVFTGDAMGNVRLLDAKTGGEVWHSKKHMRGITAVGFLPDGNRVLSASLDGTVAIWQVRPPDGAVPAGGAGRELMTLSHPNAVMSMALSPDGRQALAICIDRTERTFDEAIGKEIEMPVSTAVKLWDIESGKQLRELPVGQEIVNQAAFSPDGRYAVTTSFREPATASEGQQQPGTAQENLVRLWDLQTGEEIGPQGGVGGPFLGDKDVGGSAWSAVFAPSGLHVLTIGGNEARLWDMQGVEIMEFSPHDPVASASFSPDGSRVATTGWDGTIKIWDSRTGKSQLRLLGEHEGDINSVVFSPDGSKLLTASNDHTARLCEVASGEVVAEFRGHLGRVRNAAFSADGSRVVTASEDKTARIWNARTGEELLVLEGHGQGVLSAAFSADGTRVITGSEDTSAKVWDAQTGEQLLSLEGHTSAVTSVALSPGAQRAISGSQDHTAKIWELRTGKEVLTLKGHSEEVTSAAFAPHGQTALTASRDGTVVLWLTAGRREPAAPELAVPEPAVPELAVPEAL